jgi:hypothetical protein
LHDAELFALVVNDANLAGADSIVGADERLCRTFIESYGDPPKMSEGTPSQVEYITGPFA